MTCCWPATTGSGLAMIVAGAMTFAVMGFRQILAPPPAAAAADDATQVRGGRYSCQDAPPQRGRYGRRRAMRQRWRAVGVLAGALFAVNVAARLIIRFGFDGDDTAADRVSLAMFVVIGLILAVVAFRWGGAGRLAAWAADLAVAVLVALALTVLVGPLLVGDNPFAGGAGTSSPRSGSTCSPPAPGSDRLPGAHRPRPRPPLPAAQAVRRGQGRQAPPGRPPLDPVRAQVAERGSGQRGDPGQVGVVGGEAERPVERDRRRVVLLHLEERVRRADSAAPQPARAPITTARPAPAGGPPAAPRSG